MADNLPPLNALRAFEAAGRHLSFARAAEELFVTPAALSLQIKNLEAHLGTPLFHRLNRAVELTKAGRILHPATSDGFETLLRGWQSTKRSIDDTTLTITAGPAFTAKWLAPRMFRFALANPDIELRFSASLKIMDFERDEVDLAVRFGLGVDDGLYSEVVFDEWVTPMMHPKLAQKLTSVDALMTAPLIHDDSLSFLNPKPNWANWFKMAGSGEVRDHGPRFSNSDHAIDAAQEGDGVVLGRASLADRALRDGRLIAPFPLALWAGASYRLVYPLASEQRPALARFSEWVKSEMEGLHELTQSTCPIQITP